MKLNRQNLLFAGLVVFVVVLILTLSVHSRTSVESNNQGDRSQVLRSLKGYPSGPNSADSTTDHLPVLDISDLSQDIKSPSDIVLATASDSPLRVGDLVPSASPTLLVGFIQPTSTPTYTTEEAAVATSINTEVAPPILPLSVNIETQSPTPTPVDNQYERYQSIPEIKLAPDFHLFEQTNAATVEPTRHHTWAIDSVFVGGHEHHPPDFSDSFPSLRKIHHSQIQSVGGVMDGGDAVNTVKYFHSALRKGDVCSDMTADDSELSSWREFFKSKPQFDAFIEQTNSNLATTVAVALADENPSLAAIILRSSSFQDESEWISAASAGTSSDSLHPIESLLHDDISTSNLLSGENTNYNTESASSSSSSTQNTQCSRMAVSPSNLIVARNLHPEFNFHGPFNCFQNIPQLDELVGTQLPSEFERTLGNILCRCEYSMLRKDRPTDNSFFMYWDSIDALVTSAIRAADVCNITADEALVSNYFSRVKYSHLVVRRLGLRNSIAVDKLSVDSVSTSLQLQGPSALHLASSIVDYFVTLSQTNNSLVQLTWPDETNLNSDNSFRATSSLLHEMSKKWIISGSRVRDANETFAASVDKEYKERIARDCSPFRTQSHSFKAEVSTVPPSPLPTSLDMKLNVSDSNSLVASIASIASVASDSNASVVSVTSSVISVVNNDTVALNISASPSRRRLSHSMNSIYDKETSLSTTWEFLHDSPDSGGQDEDFNQAALQVDTLFSTNASSVNWNKRLDSSHDLNSKDRVRQMELQRREDSTFRRWIQILRLHQPAVFSASRGATVTSTGSRGIEDSTSRLTTGFQEVIASKLVYIFGRKVTLLSAKLCRWLRESDVDRKNKKLSLNRGSVVSVVTDANSIEPHAQLISNILGLRNNLLCHSSISLPQIAALLASPERADVSIIQQDIVVRLLMLSLAQPLDESICNFSLFEESLAAVLSIAAVTYIEIPSDVVLSAIFPQCKNALLNRYPNTTSILEQSAFHFFSGSKAFILELRSPSLHESSWNDARDLNNNNELLNSRIFRVEISHHPQDEDQLDKSAYKYRFNFGGASSEGDFVDSSKSSKKIQFLERSSNVGVSVYTLLTLGLTSMHKKQVLKLYVDLPLWSLSASDSSQVRPWTLFVRLTSNGEEFAIPTLSLWHHLPNETSTAYLQSLRQDSARRGYRGFPQQQVAWKDNRGSVLGVSTGSVGSVTDRKRAKVIWKAISAELISHRGDTAGGKFSFVEHNSGFGHLSTLVSKSYPNATVISIEEDKKKVEHHVKLLDSLGLTNNAVCAKISDDAVMFKNIYESPEFFRYQVVSRGLFESFESSTSLSEWGESLGMMLSSALTSFVSIPAASQVSLAMLVLFGDLGHNLASRTTYSGPVQSLEFIFSSDSQLQASYYDISQHPMGVYQDFHSRWLLGSARVRGGTTQLSVTPLFLTDEVTGKSIIQLPIVRCDILNMTRHVHHHYDYARDGHTRTYTMRVEVNNSLTEEVIVGLGNTDPSAAKSVQEENNIRLSTYSTVSDYEHNSLFDLPQFVPESRFELNGQRNLMEQLDRSVALPPGEHSNQHHIVSIHLLRDRDNFPIPYTSLYGITLITALRLGLETNQRNRLFEHFLRLPLYEDMAPWNIVLMGQSLDYIDYDTKEFKYDADVPKAYMVMTVLMNYKRTVEDFRQCGSKANTVYGLPYVSDCVGTYSRSLSCPDFHIPVPCGDGECHSDYISCLRSLSDRAAELAVAKASEKESFSDWMSQNSRYFNYGDSQLASSVAAALKNSIATFDTNGVTYSKG